MHNPRVSEGAKLHAQDELHDIESNEPESNEELHERNVKRGLKAYVLFLFFPFHLPLS